MGPHRHAAYHELLEQLSQPGCAVCALGAAAAGRYLEGLGGEALLDPPTRERLRASLGFCATHAHALEASAHRLTVAILYEDLLRCADGALDRWARERRGRGPAAPCPACEARERQEEAALRLVAASVAEPELAAAYERSPGFCLPHTIALCRRLKEPARGRVIARERARFEALRGELAEVIRKHDYRFREEPWGEERTSPERAVAKVVGEWDRAKG